MKRRDTVITMGNLNTKVGSNGKDLELIMGKNGSDSMN